MPERKVISLDNYSDVIGEYVKQFGLSFVNLDLVLERIRSGLVKDMLSSSLAKYCGEISAALITQHPDYGKLAVAVLVDFHHSDTLPTFSQKVALIEGHTHIFDPETYALIMQHAAVYDAMVDYSRDFELSYFSVYSLLRSYALRIGSTVIERPQDIFLRTAIQIQKGNFEKVKKTYDMMSRGFYTHATPTLFYSCLKKSQMASCFLLTTNEDSIRGIFKTIGDCAVISKHSGGLGLSVHDVRSEGMPLAQFGGVTKGIVPMIKVINETMKYVNQGGSKRNSSIAVYLEPWHKDILSFLELRKNTGPEEFRARDIFTALWMCDLFMERVEKDEDWSLFDPHEAPGLSDVWGDAFARLYTKYEDTKSRKVLKARALWQAILISQIETGTPYIVYKDTCNRLSNQSHLGTIKSSNLCAEIIQYSSSKETAVCNLASICLPKFVRDGTFHFNELRETVHLAVENLNRIIDSTFYPTEEARYSNMKHRPIGIGVQGLADVFIMMRYPYDSHSARILNKLIFETMYFAAIEASVELAREFGPYESYPGSYLSKGVFQWQLTNATPSGMWNWDELRERVLAHGTRNSLFIAPMPTAGTSQIFGNTECFEPIMSNIYTRRTVAGEFQIVNHHLMEDLRRCGLWSNDMRHLIMEYDGSIADIPAIPESIKKLYKTVWEIKMRDIVDMAADRQPFIDQSQSLNIYMAQPTYQKLTSMHFRGWRSGLKTGMYYLRTKPISSAIKFTVDQELVMKTLSSLQDMEHSKGEREDDAGGEVCESCSC